MCVAFSRYLDLALRIKSYELRRPGELVTREELQEKLWPSGLHTTRLTAPSWRYSLAVAGSEAYASCAVCHGTDGAGRSDGTFPRLAGQHASVVMKQIRDMQEGRRGNPIMTSHLRLLTDPSEIADLAAYIETLPSPPADDAAARPVGYATEREVVIGKSQVAEMRTIRAHVDRTTPLAIRLRLFVDTTCGRHLARSNVRHIAQWPDAAIGGSSAGCPSRGPLTACRTWPTRIVFSSPKARKRRTRPARSD